MRARSFRWSRPLALALAWYWLAGGLAAAGEADESGFKKPRSDVIAAVKTVGMLPVVVAEIAPNHDAVAERYESQVIAQLEQAGFSVVKPAAMREIRERLKQTLGGLYDPVTGREVPGKVKAFNEYARNEYLATQKVDATLWVGIIVRPARMSGFRADWDGVSDTATGRSGVGGFLTDTFGGNTFSGVLPALSVGVVLSDSHGERLYEHAGGLQLLMYVRREGTEFAQRHIDPQSILTDPARDARALELALDPLTRGSTQTSKVKVEVTPIEPAVEGNALRVPRQELLSRYHSVAIAALTLADMPQRAEAERRYQELLATKLRQLGFTVAADSDYADLWKTEVAAAKGYYDPFTGKLDRAKLQASRKRVFAALHDKHPIDAVVLPEIAARAAPFSSGKARWDGVVEPVSTRKSGLGALLDRDSGYLGSVSALSLVVRIADGDDTTLFEDSGGIQVTERLINGHRVEVPQAERLADAAKNQQAVEVALRELAPAVQRR